jgi:hypothetical protein
MSALVTVEADPFAAARFPKVCSCGVEYGRRQWCGLELLGRMADEFEEMELRNCCLCGSSLALVTQVFKEEVES